MEDQSSALTATLARRDGILDTLLALREYSPMSLRRAALNTYLMAGHQEKALPIQLRRAQEKVLELLI